MSYQVLARKWRPARFSEMVGQEHVLKALVNALDHDRLHHAYLFTGTRGVGKTTLARILARCLNCERGTGSEPCGECDSCREIAEGRSVDLLEVDAASRTKVEDTRELLDNVQYAPTRSRYKVYLIDEVHMLSTHSFNALLKTLEEPPPHVKFLLATTDPQKLPATVLSRCLQFNLKNMPPDQVAGHLRHVLAEEDIEFEDPALWLLGRAAGGSMRDALSLTDQAIAFGSGSVREAEVRDMLGTVDLDFVYRLLEAVSAGEPGPALQVIAQMAEHAPDFEASLDELISLLHRVAIAQAVPDAIDNSWGDAERVGAIARSLSPEDVQLFYQMAVNGKRDLPLAVEPRAGFEMIALRMIAFRPEVVIDPGLSPQQLQAATTAVAPEGDLPVKKCPDSGPTSAVAPVLRPPTEPPPAEPDRAVPPPTGPHPAEPHRAEPHRAEPHRAEPHRAEPSQVSAKSVRPAAEPRAAAPNPVSDVESPERAASGPAAGRGIQGGLSPDAWLELAPRLGLTGAVQNIALNCECRRWAPGQVELRLDNEAAGLFNPGRHPDMIRRALVEHIGEDLQVRVEPGVIESTTPAREQRLEAAARQQQAVTEIESDPLLQQLIDRFDGELDRASIAPLDN